MVSRSPMSGGRRMALWVADRCLLWAQWLVLFALVLLVMWISAPNSTGG